MRSTFSHGRTELSLAAQGLLCFSRLLCLEGELSLAEPKRLRQRLLHIAGRTVCSGRHGRPAAAALLALGRALVMAFRRLRTLHRGSGP